MRGERLVIKRSTAVAFAREWAARQGQKRTITYHLSYPNGGGVPRTYADLFHDPEDQLDCIGAVFSILGCDRVQPAPWPFYFDKRLGYGYANCDTIIKDADGPRILFTDAAKEPGGVVAGDIVVFGSRFIGGHGHVGFLTGEGRVVHCSPSNTRKLGHALAETPAGVFLSRKDRRYLRYRHWAPEGK